MSLAHVLRETGAVLVAALLIGSVAFAQSSSSVIIGTVTNADHPQGATGAPLVDVVVTATSPNLQGEQTVVTDAQGQYRIPQLPPGLYTLRFESEGFQPFSRSDVQLRLNRTIRLNVELRPEGLTEQIEITGTPPTIDVGSTTIGVNVDQEFIRRIAVNRPGGKGGAARSFESLAELAPGAQNDNYGVSINGATSPENGYVVDGLSTNDPAFGINASPLSIEFVQDVNVITGGYMPEYGRSTGGVLNAVTRSGSNEFHGSVFANMTPGVFEGERTLPLNEGSVITGLNSLKNLGDFGATLGGPILQDKLWFFAGFAPSFTRYNHVRGVNAFVLDENGEVMRNEQGQSIVQPIPGAETTYFADSRSFQYMGKLTYLINADHNVALSLTGTPSSTGGLGRLRIDPRSGGLPVPQTMRPDSIGVISTNASTTALGAKYGGAFLDKKVLLDVNAGWFHQVASDLPADGSQLGDILGDGLSGYSRAVYVQPRSLLEFENPGQAAAFCEPAGLPSEDIKRCPVNNYELGGAGLMRNGRLDRYQVNAKATYLLNMNELGTHVIKAGVDTEFLSYKQQKGYGGGVLFQEVDVGGFIDPRTGQEISGEYGWVDFRRFGHQDSPDSPTVQPVQQSTTKSTTVGGFLQDSWTLYNRVTLNLGMRYDVQAMYGGDGNLALVLGNQWSPRLGAIVDPLANGRMKFFINYAKYYEQVPLNMVERSFPPERRYNARRVAPQPGLDGGCDPSTRDGQRGDCADSAYVARRPESSLNPNRLYSGGKVEPSPVDPDLEAQSSNEWVIGGEYEVLANTRFGANFTHRTMGSVIEDMSRDLGNTYFLGNPGQGFAKDFPKAERTYDALTLYLNRTFADGWLAQFNYTWSRLHGNYPGLFRPETEQLDPNILSDFDLIDLLDNRTGLLSFDRTHAVKLFGAREFVINNELSANVGVSYRGNSGTPISYWGAHPEYGQDEAFVLPRGTGGRTPWVNVIDSNVGVNYRLGRNQVVSVTLDVFNLFNFQTATRVDESYTFEEVLPVKDGTEADLPTEDSPGNVRRNSGGLLTYDGVNANFRKPKEYQAPRQLRFGIRYTF